MRQERQLLFKHGSETSQNSYRREKYLAPPTYMSGLTSRNLTFLRRVLAEILATKPGYFLEGTVSGSNTLILTPLLRLPKLTVVLISSEAFGVTPWALCRRKLAAGASDRPYLFVAVFPLV